MEKEFVIRSYGYGELAILYFPNSTKKSATTQLSNWISINSKLTINLEFAGFKKRQRNLTPKQVSIIIEHLGEP